MWDDVYNSGRVFLQVNLVWFDRVLDRIVATTGQRPRTALDLGSGAGELCIVCASRGLQVKGLDISRAAIRKAEESLGEYPELQGLISFDQRDFNQVGEEGEVEKVDLIFMRLTFAFMSDQSRFLRYVRNSLKMGGRFVLMTPVTVEGYEYSDFMRKISVPLKELEEVLGSAFSEVETFNCSFNDDASVEMTYILSR
jgi:cyclopropane fatty-acyl-phospholipid synthase-like methyltransferase